MKIPLISNYIRRRNLEKEKEALEWVRIQERNARNQRRIIRRDNFYSRWENWIRNAEPILADIIKENINEMDGFKYFKYKTVGYGAESVHGRIKIINGEIYSIDIGEWSREGQALRTTEDRESKGMLNIIRPSEFYFDREDIKYMVFLNKKRNEIVKEIEKRTGRNLKRDVNAVSSSQKPL